jgi:hypothetical protein
MPLPHFPSLKQKKLIRKLKILNIFLKIHKKREL